MNAQAARRSTTFRLGEIKLDASEFGSQGSAILGIRDSGKSYTATALAVLAQVRTCFGLPAELDSQPDTATVANNRSTGLESLCM